MDDNRFLDAITSDRTAAILLGAVVLLLLAGGIMQWMK